MIVALIATHFDSRKAVRKGTTAGCIADEASIGGIGCVVDIDADDADAVLEPCIVAPVPSGKACTVLVGSADVAAYDEVLHSACEVVEHAGLFSFEVVIECDGVPCSVEGARVRSGVRTEHEVQALDVASKYDVCTFIASHL